MCGLCQAGRTCLCHGMPPARHVLPGAHPSLAQKLAQKMIAPFCQQFPCLLQAVLRMRGVGPGPQRAEKEDLPAAQLLPEAAAFLIGKAPPHPETQGQHPASGQCLCRRRRHMRQNAACQGFAHAPGIARHGRGDHTGLFPPVPQVHLHGAGNIPAVGTAGIGRMQQPRRRHRAIHGRSSPEYPGAAAPRAAVPDG